MRIQLSKGFGCAFIPMRGSGSLAYTIAQHRPIGSEIMEQQQTISGIAYTNVLMQRLMQQFLLHDVLPGDKQLPFNERRFELLLRCVKAEGYGK